MKVSTCNLAGILLIDPQVHTDSRGFFLESFEQDRYHKIGIKEEFVQDNHSRSFKNVLRGLHFTKNNQQTQIVTVIRGRVFDVVVDVRKNSSTFGQWFGTELSDVGTRQIYMSHGFAHGFCVLSEWADLHYKVSQRYDPNEEDGLIWNDDSVNIEWPIINPILSERDQKYKKLDDI